MSAYSFFFIKSLFFFPESKIEFLSKIFYHPNNFSDKKFFKHTIRLQENLNKFSNSHNKFVKLYFHRLAKSAFKFRKRKNVYFTLLFSASPAKKLLFFQNLPSLLKLYFILSKRIAKIYRIKTGIFKLKYRKQNLAISFFNPNIFNSFINNEEIKKDLIIIKLNIFFKKQDKPLFLALVRKLKND